MGRALIELLVSADHIEKVITLTRRQALHPSAKVCNHVIDFDRINDYVSLFQGDVLFSCLGPTLKQAGCYDEQRKVDLDYQLTAAELAACNGVSHYVLVSSSGANANSKNPYLKMKGELEEKANTLPFKRITLLQPSLLLGKRSELRVAEKIAGWLLPVLCMIPGLRPYRPISAEQVARRMLLASKQPGPPLEVYSLDEIFVEGDMP